MVSVTLKTDIIKMLLFQQNRKIKRESIGGCNSVKSSWNQTVDQFSSDISERAGRRDVVTEPVINSTVDLVHVVDAF